MLQGSVSNKIIVLLTDPCNMKNVEWINQRNQISNFFIFFFFGQKCIDREDKVYRGNNQVINLTTNYIWSGCRQQTLTGVEHLVCNGKYSFV